MTRSDEHDDTLEASPRATLEPERATLDAAGQLAVARLARIQRGALTIEGQLGEGGMGLVHLATQTALGRKVAVKTLRSEQRGPASTMQLLREAWVTGALEHPNVVPVYDVSLDGDGAPVVVLRRIEGTEWSALMPEAELVARRYGAHDLLEWNLRVLIQVCNAVHFAHQRGIVHRDLKPDNVMLGELGEVYLLDWGIAVALKDDGSGRLPLRMHAHQPAGTPAYMAPEMWAGEPELLTVRTDVYLLGAILYEILTGRPPHTGTTLKELRERSASMPPLPETPAALVEICRLALDADPARRPESALALRQALDGFLELKEAGRLVDEALLALERLRAATAVATPLHAGVYNLFGACRFGFEQALAHSAEARGAREGLVAATTAMVDYELRAGDPRAAETLLAALPAPPPALQARVAEATRLRNAEEEKRRGLEALGRDWDDEVGKRTRLFLGMLIGVGWSVLPLLGALTGRWPRSHRAQGLMTAGFLLLVLMAVFWARESLLRTQLNRGLLGAMVLAPLAQLVLIIGGWLAGIPPEAVHALHQFSWFVLCGMLGAMIDWRLFFPTASYLAGFLLAAAWPQTRLWSTAFGNMVLTGALLWMWLPGLRGRLLRPRSRGAKEMTDT